MREACGSAVKEDGHHQAARTQFRQAAGRTADRQHVLAGSEFFLHAREFRGPHEASLAVEDFAFRRSQRISLFIEASGQALPVKPDVHIMVEAHEKQAQISLDFLGGEVKTDAVPEVAVVPSEPLVIPAFCKRRQLFPSVVVPIGVSPSFRDSFARFIFSGFPAVGEADEEASAGGEGRRGFFDAAAEEREIIGFGVAAAGPFGVIGSHCFHVSEQFVLNGLGFQKVELADMPADFEEEFRAAEAGGGHFHGLSDARGSGRLPRLIEVLSAGGDQFRRPDMVHPVETACMGGGARVGFVESGPITFHGRGSFRIETLIKALHGFLDVQAGVPHEPGAEVEMGGVHGPGVDGFAGEGETVEAEAFNFVCQPAKGVYFGPGDEGIREVEIIGVEAEVSGHGSPRVDFLLPEYLGGADGIAGAVQSAAADGGHHGEDVGVDVVDFEGGAGVIAVDIEPEEFIGIFSACDGGQVIGEFQHEVAVGGQTAGGFDIAFREQFSALRALAEPASVAGSAFENGFIWPFLHPSQECFGCPLNRFGIGGTELAG